MYNFYMITGNIKISDLKNIMDEQWSDVPYSTKFMEKVIRYWIKNLTNINFTIIDGKNNQTSQEKTDKFNIKMEDLNLQYHLEKIIAGAINSGQSLVWNYTLNGKKYLKSSDNVVRFVENFNGDLQYAEALEITKSGTEIFYIMTKIFLEKGKYIVESFLAKDKKGNKYNNESDKEAALANYRNTFGTGMPEPQKLDHLEAKMFKFYQNRENTAFGVSDVSLIQARLYKLDIVWNKIIEEVLYRTTGIVARKSSGTQTLGNTHYDQYSEDNVNDGTNVNESTSQETILKEIKAKAANTFKFFEFATGNDGNTEFDIVVDRPDPSLLSMELDKEEMRISAILNIPKDSDNRSFQSSKDEVASANSGVDEEVRHRIKMLKIAIKYIINFHTTDTVIVDIPFTDSSIRAQAVADPIKLLQSGLSRAEVRAALTGEAKLIARKNIILNNNITKKDPIWFALMSNGSALDINAIKGLEFVDKEAMEKEQGGKNEPSNPEPHKSEVKQVK